MAAELVGIDYVTSQDKIQFDERFKALFGPLAAFIEQQAIQTLAPCLEPGTDPYFEHYRRGPDGEPFVMRKVRTMHDGEGLPTDEDLQFHKLNPRIISRGALLIRNLGLDELPQFELVPETLSMVGPRAVTDEFLDHLTSMAATVDPGIARDYPELYHYPGIRHGFTGPCQLKWQWSYERDAKLITSALRADLEYYPNKATAREDVKIIAATPVHLAASAVWKHLLKRRNLYESN